MNLAEGPMICCLYLTIWRYSRFSPANFWWCFASPLWIKSFGGKINIYILKNDIEIKYQNLRKKILLTMSIGVIYLFRISLNNILALSVPEPLKIICQLILFHQIWVITCQLYLLALIRIHPFPHIRWKSAIRYALCLIIISVPKEEYCCQHPYMKAQQLKYQF